MTHLELFLLAIALSIDACVVSFSYGISFNTNKLKNALLLAFSTSFFQGLMPCIGFLLTFYIKTLINPYADWIVFLIFIFLGLKFIKEAFETNNKQPNCIGLCCLFLIGIATSIDAFSAGISLALYEISILKSSLLITFVTFINSLIGFYLGGNLKNMPKIYLEILAGLILIGLGIKAIL